MTWNYRVIHDHAKSGEDVYAIHEVYYRADEPRAMTVRPVYPCGSNIEEFRKDLDCYMDALNKPLLEDTDFVNV